MAHPRSLEEVESLLRQAEQRAEKAERERQEEKQRAEKAERERQEEKQRADASEEQTRPTTLDEYIAACHSLVFSKLTVETDPKLTTKGSTNPRDKWCPSNLRPWSDFIERQRVVFGTLCDTFPAQSRVFESQHFLAGLGNRISQRSIGNEKTLEYFMHNSVEDPVKAIVDQLKQVEDVRNEFDIGNGIIFENHPHAISDIAEEVVERESLSNPPQTPDHRRDLNKLRPDQICIYRSDDALSTMRTMVYVSEYKPPHKLTAPHLRLGLRAMNIHTDVINRKTIPMSVDPDAQFQYHADKLTASAITQTYHYMILGGLEYGLLTTGEAVVFLRVDWEEPETLYYHLAEPGPEVSAHPNHFHVCTAVGQYLAFSLMALGLPGQRQGHGQQEREQATLRLGIWAEDFETTLKSIPEGERRAPDSSSSYAPTTYEGVDRSPYHSRRKRRLPNRANQADKGPSRRDPPESDDEPGPNQPDTPTPTEQRSKGGGQGIRRSQRIAAQRPRGDGEQDRQYCTQKCLLGLVKNGFLDPDCPNVALHYKQDGCDLGHDRAGTQPRAYAGNRHPVDHAEWLQLLSQQLKQSLDDGITPLGHGGARSVLFQVTLLAYSYTFVSKGTVQAFIRDLEHEAAVYERLWPIQGVNVPIFLGAIDLRLMNKIYYYDHRVYVVHMTFLSWGGHHMDRTGGGDVEGRLLEAKALRSLRAIHQQGVLHRDVRVENMLFNSETNEVFIIDFERALLLRAPKRPLAQLVPNKRVRNDEMTDDKAARGLSNRSLSSRPFREEAMMVNRLFSGL